MNLADKTQTEGLPQSPVEISTWQQRIAPWILLLAFVLYATYLGTHVGAYAAGSDQSGYLNSAILLGKGTSYMQQRVLPGTHSEILDPETYIPLGFRHNGSTGMVPVYSIGLPLLIAGTAKIIGWNAAPHAVIVILSLLGILATAWLAHEWELPGVWPWIAALMLACCLLYVTYSLQLMSDMPALLFATLAVAQAWKSRTRMLWALGAGATMAYAVMVRPNNALVFLPVAICLGLDWRRWALLAGGGMPGGIIFCSYSYFTYGHAFQTGYGSSLNHLFSPAYVFSTLPFYVYWLPIMLTPVGVLFVGLPFLIPCAPRKALVLIVWIASISIFYTFYRPTHEIWWSLRFLLPTFPPMLVGSLWVLRSGLQSGIAVRLQKRLVNFLQRSFGPASVLAAWMATALCVFLAFRNNGREHRFYFRYTLPMLPLVAAGVFYYMRRHSKSDHAAQLRVTGIALLMCTICYWNGKGNILMGTEYAGKDGLMYIEACQWADEHLPANSVIYTFQSSGAVLCYTPFTLARYDNTAPAQQNEILRTCTATGRPIYAMLLPFETDSQITGHGLSGNWELAKKVDLISFWKLKNAAPAQP